MKKKTENENAEPIQQSVHVDCPVEDAFRFFTEGFGKWWPLGGSDSGANAQTCEIEPWVGGRVLERSRSGAEHEWGAVTTWSPPGSLEFTWHPGGPEDQRQTVSVEFQREADGTRVTLTHRGWQLAGVTVCIADTAAPAANVVQGLVVCWASNWNPVAIGRHSGAPGSPAGPIGSYRREIAWRNVTRPTWAEAFLNSFAAFAKEQLVAA
jgi:hypothetical protein